VSYHIYGYRFARPAQLAAAGELPPGPGTPGSPEPEGTNGGRKYTAERALLEADAMAAKPYDIHQLAGSATFGEIAYPRPRARPPARGGPGGYAGGTGAGCAPGSPVPDRR
jgi:hypothetical protein